MNAPALDPTSDPYPLITIAGPTASGKSALALALAERFGGEIVSCDSVAVYRGFEIGTAKPSHADRTRVPHHLIDLAEATQPFTAGDYARAARTALAGIRDRGRLPIVAGGTGFYMRALLEGLFAGPHRDESLRERLRSLAASKGPSHLHRVLGRLDPEAASRIHPNDTPKLVRSVEICFSSGERVSEMFQRGRDPLTGFHIIKLALDPDRAALYERINGRCQVMFANGLVEETRGLLERYGNNGLLEDPSSPINALGYRQAVQYLRGELTLEQAIAAAQKGHRNYAKRQLTWSRNIGAEGLTWLAGFGDDPSIQESAFQIAARSIPR
ncbi:MAG: tRNA (adenosine(37)-N6)-dimethylallyltransferase MiaA [Acidobacteriales bacterium]|nr:tRNA (adenosine(37)-N6)-dimethylallyltransferase MiaA [Terriglobales bacterium]